jgi:hypothetical protein
LCIQGTHNRRALHFQAGCSSSRQADSLLRLHPHSAMPRGVLPASCFTPAFTPRGALWRYASAQSM